MFITQLVFILMPISIYLSFLWAPSAVVLGESSRILYYHVPLAWVAVLAFFVSGIFSIVYLYDKDKKFSLIDEKAHNSALIGLLFIVLATVTGSIWSKISWGAFWNWDPRQRAIAFLLLIYFAYFALRIALQDNPLRGKISGAYLIFAMVTVPFFVFILPRMYKTLHPDTIVISENRMQMDPAMRITLLVSIVSFTLLYFYLLQLLNRISYITKKVEVVHYDS